MNAITGQLTENILSLTAQIEENYPELYKYLEENAQLNTDFSGNDPTSKELENHLSTLKQYLTHHIQTHSYGKNI